MDELLLRGLPKVVADGLRPEQGFTPDLLHIVTFHAFCEGFEFLCTPNNLKFSQGRSALPVAPREN